MRLAIVIITLSRGLEADGNGAKGRAERESDNPPDGDLVTTPDGSGYYCIATSSSTTDRRFTVFWHASAAHPSHNYNST